MKPGPALAAWLDDPAARAASRARASAVARWWRRQDAVQALERELAAAPAGDPAASLAAADAFLADPRPIETLLARLIDEQARDPFFQPPFRAVSHEVQSGVVLIDDPRCVVQLGVLPIDALSARKRARGGDGVIAFSGAVTLYRFLRAGGATLSVWRTRAIDDGFDIADPPACMFAYTQRLEDGARLLLDGRRSAFVIEAATGDMVVAQAMIGAGRTRFAVDFAAATGRCLGARSTDEAGSRAQLLASLLRSMGREDAGPAVAALTHDRDFGLRWHAMRELLAIDASRALPRLTAMAADDAHRDVRQAARVALERVAACRG